MRKGLAYFSIVFILCMSLTGCASWIAKAPKVVLMPEERIYTIPAGKTVEVLLDQKNMNLTLSQDMKLVSPTILVRQEQKLNDALLKKTKADEDKKKVVGIVGSILGILAFGLGIVFRKNLWPKIKFNANAEVK